MFDETIPPGANFDKAVALDARNPELYKARAAFLEAQKQYSDAHTVYESHLKQIAAAAAADADAAEPSNYSSDTAAPEGAAQAPAGSLVNDEQLAALRERLAGN